MYRNISSAAVNLLQAESWFARISTDSCCKPIGVPTAQGKQVAARDAQSAAG